MSGTMISLPPATISLEQASGDWILIMDADEVIAAIRPWQNP